MGEPFLGELKIFSFNFAPKGWALCNGQQLPINQNQALFSILGTTYGGNGQTTFALPNLQGRVPFHTSFNGNGFALGQTGGEESHTLTQSEMPAHIHTLNGFALPATINPPANNRLAEPVAIVAGTTINISAYGTGGSDRQMAPQSVASVGGSQPHENRSPFLVLNVCIALQGVFPSQT